MAVTWPVRSVIAGAAGTATMTLAYASERRLRKRAKGPLDYDDSLVPGQIVASVMHLPHVTDREEHELGLMLRWSYGSAFGLLHGELRRRAVPEPWASAAFGGTLITATMTLFPLAGPDATALALAGGDACDKPGHACCVRACGGSGGPRHPWRRPMTSLPKV